MMRLQVQPELAGHLEVAAQSQSRVGGNSPLALDNLIDAARRHADIHRQPVLALTHRLEKVLGQNFSRSDVCQQFAFHFSQQ